MPTPSPGFSDLLRWGAAIIRPRLRIREQGRTRKKVVTAGHTQVNLVRLWIQNYGFGMRARECGVYLNRITFGGEDRENERSPLRWTDINTFDPQTVNWGKGSMMPVDLCEVFQSEGLLRIDSRKAITGGLTYNRTGTYTFEVSTDALSPVSNDRVFVDVYYDNKDWTTLKVIGFHHKRRWPRVWTF